jgi:hypothetical protein
MLSFKQMQMILNRNRVLCSASIEAGYIAASEAAKEAIWIRNFVSELCIVSSVSSPMDLYYDNNGAIA